MLFIGSSLDIYTVVLFLLRCFWNDSGLHNWPKLHFPLNNRRPLMSFFSPPCSHASVKSHSHASGCFSVYQPEFEKAPQKNKPCVSRFRIPPLEWATIIGSQSRRSDQGPQARLTLGLILYITPYTITIIFIQPSPSGEIWIMFPLHTEFSALSATVFFFF